MNRIQRSIPVLLLLIATACGPLVMVPGGQLDGTPSEAPSDWSFSDAVEVVQLETNPDDPYSVNIWGVASGGDFYVAAGDRESQWAQNMNADPRVRLKIGDALYELRAEATNDEADLDRFLTAAKKKYDFELEEGQREEAALYRLIAR